MKTKAYSRKLTYLRVAITTGLLLCITAVAKAQVMPLSFSGRADFHRRAQLINWTDTSTSFTIRPMLTEEGKDWAAARPQPKTLSNLQNKPINYQILPFSWIQQHNNHYPYAAWNDGAMIPAKGYQTLLSGGIHAQWGNLEIQLKPELVLADNPAFTTIPKEHYEVIFARYYDYYNRIDLPERFGNDNYQKAFWGQSSIKYNWKSLSIGFSTENRWWGPGLQNSIILSNSAPGFKHFSLQTNKPIKTPFGRVEAQLIAGWPQSSGQSVQSPDTTYFNNPINVPKADRQRYLSGMIFSWQPKWVKGLYLGFSRTMQLYAGDQQYLGDYLPLFAPFQSYRADDAFNKRQQMGLLFFRWVWPETQTEIYGEWGRHDQSASFRSTALDPERNRAYVFGLRKLLWRPNREHYFSLSGEVIQLQETNLSDIRNFNSWYTSSYIRQGYTHEGQPLGAGIGPGANMQQIAFSWHKGLKKIGLQVERYLHNNDFYYYAYEDSYDFRRHWYDLSLRLNTEWDFNQLLISSNITATRSYNYGWYLKQGPNDPYFVHGLNNFNLQLQLGVHYIF